MSNLANVSLATDGVFGDDSGATQLATITGDVASGYTIALSVGVDTTTAAGGGTITGGGRGERGSRRPAERPGPGVVGRRQR